MYPVLKLPRVEVLVPVALVHVDAIVAVATSPRPLP